MSYVGKIVEINNKKIKLNIWDTIGQEKFRSISKMFLKETHIVILVYDITAKESFNQLDYWYNLYKENLGPNTILGVAANKSDLYEEQEVSDQAGIEYAKNHDATFSLISAKENEVVYPTIEDFISITDNAYNKSELLYMEIHVLQSLNFDILFPTPDEFYNILSKIFNFNKLQHHFGEYFLDSALIDYNMLKYKYSTISIACIFNLNGYKDLYSSKFILGDTTEKLIKECSKYLCFLVKNLSKSYLKATKEKYSSKEFDNVEAICEEK